MLFDQALNETTLWTHGGGPKTVHDPKRSKFAHEKLKKKKKKNIHIKDYEDAIKGKKPYFTWIWPIKGKI